MRSALRCAPFVWYGNFRGKTDPQTGLNRTRARKAMAAQPDRKAQSFQWGPTNPHPLSQMRTELVWEGKYDEFGNRREVDIAGATMPLQKIETVDEPRSQAAAAGDQELLTFDKQMAGKRRDDFRNRLIWGDNKLVMASLLKEFKGKVDLFYIDPPFDVGADFTMDVPIGDGKETLGKDQSALEMVAYRDMWGKGTDSYLHMMFERLTLMKELLSERGTIYVHCDYRVQFMLRAILDEVFTPQNFLNEVIWRYEGPQSPSPYKFATKNDRILRYSKTGSRCTVGEMYFEEVIPESEASFSKDESGRWFYTLPRGDYTDDSIAKLELEGRIHHTRSGGIRIKYFVTRTPEGHFLRWKKLSDVWDDIPSLGLTANKAENMGYSTQKPEPLVERIIKASSNPDDLVADVFCGSGTTGAVAERLGRRWIMADLGRFAIHTSRKRLIELQRTLHAEGKPYRAFDVYNLGRYERQWWQKDRLKGAEEEHRRVVLEFFKAEVLANAPSPLLHGRKAGAFCHVDGIDSVFTRGEATAVAQAVAQAGGREAYCLAWEFEMELRQHCLALEVELGVKLKLIPIPREIMEKNRTSPPPFLEMAVLEAEPVARTEKKQKLVDVKLTKFLPSLAEVPSKELAALKERAIKSGMDFVDFWAVDFEWQPGKPFNHHWQDYRTRKDRSLKTVSDAGHVYL